MFSKIEARIQAIEKTLKREGMAKVFILNRDNGLWESNGKQYTGEQIEAMKQEDDVFIYVGGNRDEELF